jgi:hypothetical protein
MQLMVRMSPPCELMASIIFCSFCIFTFLCVIRAEIGAIPVLGLAGKGLGVSVAWRQEATTAIAGVLLGICTGFEEVKFLANNVCQSQ